MRLIGVKLLTAGRGTWLNRRSIENEANPGGTGASACAADAPFGVEGKEFLLTLAVQSVMNIFTAFGFSVQFCVCPL
jgi:hypothetical protein